jgi:hypothetical protein
VPGQEVNKYSHNKKGLFWADLKKFSYWIYNKISLIHKTVNQIFYE